MKKIGFFICNIVFVSIFLISGFLFISCGEKKLILSNTNFPVGVWWWDNRLSNDYLIFASENNVDEIYYYTSDFSHKNADFIKESNNLGIKVYWLCGEYQWLDDYNLFYEEMEKFEQFQNNQINKFEGVHIDLEPHQHPNWNSNKEELIVQYIDFVKTITNKYKFIKFDFDLPFWLEDIINYDEKTQEAFKYVIDYANRVFVMSYRDSAEDMVNVAMEELQYANEKEKQIFISVETGEEEDIVTYYEEGKEYLYSQIEKLDKIINQNFGLAIHHIKSWYQLKD